MPYQTALPTSSLAIQPTTPTSIGRWVHWGSYASLAQLPNSSGNAFGAPGFALLAPGDLATVSGEGVYTCVSPGTVGASNAVWTPVRSEVIARWNRLDKTQWKAARNYNTFAAADAVTLTVVAPGPVGVGPVLRLATTGVDPAAVNQCAFWLLNQSFGQLDFNQYRYTLRMRVVGFSGTAPGGSLYGGFAFMCTDAGDGAQYGYSQLVSDTTNLWWMKVEGGVRGAVNPFVGGGAVPTDEVVEVELVGRHVPTNVPDFHLLGRYYGGIAPGAAVGLSIRETNLGAPFLDPNWGTQVLDRIGLAIQFPGGFAPGPALSMAMDIADFAVLRHPIDT